MKNINKKKVIKFTREDLSKITKVNKRYTEESLLKKIDKLGFSKKDNFFISHLKTTEEFRTFLGLLIEYDIIEMRTKG